MKYMTVREASCRWGVDTSRIGRLIREGRIEGARMCGRKWLIPENATKPKDARTRQMKEQPREMPFRFPLFVNFEADDFTMPLSAEERMLCKAQKDFFSCDFQNAKKSFSVLSEQAENTYVKISAVFFMCVLCIVYDMNINWNHYYSRLNLLLSSDLPYKKEMRLFLPWLDCFQGRFEAAREKLRAEVSYDYHPTAWYMYLWLSVLHFSAEIPDHKQIHFTDSYEMLCHMMEHDGHYLEAQELHSFLFAANFASADHQRGIYHLRSAIRIAVEHDLYYLIADLISYYHDAADEVLGEFPEETAALIQEKSHLIYNNFILFSQNYICGNLYSLLSAKDFPLAIYAVSGFSNKQVADILKVSQRTIVNRYNEIYNRLGVCGKAELIEMISSAFKI